MLLKAKNTLVQHEFSTIQAKPDLLPVKEARPYMKCQGLSATQLKWIALIFMTLDHMIPLFTKTAHLSFVVPYLEIIGRIAAPLFLFLVTESFRHTRSRWKFVLRLYVAGVAVDLSTFLANFIIFGNLACYWPGNILFTYFYTVWLLTLILSVSEAYKLRNRRKMIGALFLIALTALPQVTYSVFDNMFSLSARVLFTAVFPPPLFIEYSLAFVFMGIVFYFLRGRTAQCIAFAIFCVINYGGSILSLRGWDLWPFNLFFADGQHWMILALPFMAMYNGQRGKSQKVFFYVYYPTHRYLIFLLETLLF